MDLFRLSAKEISDGVRAKKISAEDVTRACLGRISAYENDINALVTVTGDRAIKHAREIDARVRAGEDPGPLAGVPYVAKDNFCTKGVKTTCSSNALAEWVPTYDASAVGYLDDAGAIMLGKANMDEFAMGSSTESSISGPTKNPRALDRVPGGSSGGSAASVAAGYAPISLGSDTGGSVRQPAAFCGLQGMKPSYGQISRYGVVGYASSLDQPGMFARSVEDLALSMEVLARPDPNDATCDTYARPKFTEALGRGDLKGKRIGIFGGFDERSASGGMHGELYDALLNTAKICENAGASVEPVSLPLTFKYAIAVYYITALADASSKLACYDGIRYGIHVDGDTLSEMYDNTRAEAFGEEARRRIILGTLFLSGGFYENYYAPAQKVRTKIASEFEAFFEKYDAYLLPTTPSLPYHFGEKEADPKRIYLSDISTVPVNLAGLPGINLCAGFNEEGLPLSVQLVGPRYGDFDLLGIASILEGFLGRPGVADKANSSKEVA